MSGGLLYAMTLWLILAPGMRIDRIHLPFFGLSTKVGSKAGPVRRHEPEQANVPQTAPDLDYKLWRTVCIQDPPGKLCLAFISVDSAVLTREGVLHLGSRLEKRFRRRSRVKAFLFDNPKWAEAHARFKAELRDLDRHIRGVYYVDRRKCEEYVKFSSSKSKPWDEMTVVLHNSECKKS